MGERAVSREAAWDAAQEPAGPVVSRVVDLVNAVLAR